MGHAKPTILERAWAALQDPIVLYTLPGAVLFIPAWWFHATYTLESGFLIGANFLLPGVNRLEILAVALIDEWQLAIRLTIQEYCEDCNELSNGLALHLGKNYKAAPSVALVALVTELLDHEAKLKITGKEPASGNVRKAMERLQKYIDA
ncbi:hypothetical protein BGX38DRAFT_1272300 [Terfezia claveryi]|nr:hypothetical protein BGX38DRAFT_1272300 [Terfezia claveryi]